MVAAFSFGALRRRLTCRWPMSPVLSPFFKNGDGGGDISLKNEGFFSTVVSIFKKWRHRWRHPFAGGFRTAGDQKFAKTVTYLQIGDGFGVF